MEAKTYKILGILLLIVGIIWVGGAILEEGIIGFFYWFISPFLQGGDYWEWGLFVSPIFFIIAGIYYLKIGIKQSPVNKLISYSAGFQISSLITAIVGLIATIIGCIISRGGDGWCIILFVPFGALALILSVIGFLSLILGWILKDRELTRGFIITSILIIIIIVSLILGIFFLIS